MMIGVFRSRRMAGNLQAIDARQPQVEHDEIRLLPAELDQRSLPIAGFDDREARLFEIGTDELDDLAFVVHHQDFGAQLHLSAHYRPGGIVAQGVKNL